MFNQQPTIPKSIHFIWVGKLLNSDGRNNIKNWKKTNPDYDVNLWIDSSLYPEKFAQTDDYINFMNWAKENKIIIKDICGIHSQMYNKEFYDNAIIGQS